MRNNARNRLGWQSQTYRVYEEAPVIIRIDQSDEVPIYLQIRNQIIEGIARGELSPGDSLPSVRQLAADLGINLHTVNKAYAVLRDEGYVAMRGRKGAFIANEQSIGAPSHQTIDDERMASGIYRLALEHRARGGTPESFIVIAKSQVKRAFESERDSRSKGSLSQKEVGND